RECCCEARRRECDRRVVRHSQERGQVWRPSRVAGLRFVQGKSKKRTHRAEPADGRAGQDPGVERRQVHRELCSQGPPESEGGYEEGSGEEGVGEESTGKESCEEQQEALRKGGT